MLLQWRCYCDEVILRMRCLSVSHHLPYLYFASDKNMTAVDYATAVVVVVDVGCDVVMPAAVNDCPYFLQHTCLTTFGSPFLC